MEKKNFIVVAAIVIIATMLFTGCSDNKATNTANTTAKKDVIRVVLPESLKDKVDVHLYYEPQASVLKNNDAAAKQNQEANKTAQAPKADANKAPEIIKLGSLDEYRTLEVLNANEQLAKQEVEAIEKQLASLKEGKASLEKQIAEKKGNEVTLQRLQIVDLQIQLENNKLASARKYLDEKVQIRQQAENALNQRNIAANKKCWYKPNTWF